MQGLLSLLSEDAIFYSDGGGKVVTARNPVYGPDRVARLMLGLARKRWPGYAIRLAGINGPPGIVGYSGDRPDSVLDLEIAGGRIRTVRHVRNPDKLHAVSRLSETYRREDRRRPG